MFEKNYTERDIVELVRLLPPSTIRIRNSLTLNAIKGIFSILWDNPYFAYSNIVYEKQDFLNVGIGFGLREYIYSKNP